MAASFVSATSLARTTCNRSNLPAQCLFERCGFQRSGQIYNLDEGDPELVYFKALTR